MNTQENNIPFLHQVLEEYQQGTLDMTQKARKCYLSEKDKLLGKPTWVHNDELKNHITLGRISKANSKEPVKRKTNGKTI